MTFRSTIPILLEMLSYRRPADSPTEREFINRFLLPLPDAHFDAFGNVHVLVGNDPSIIWSSHTDTVHRGSGRQGVQVSENHIVHLSKRGLRRTNCLGADNSAGVFVCHQLILAGVPGHYIFHRCEERGGLGSMMIATQAPELLEGATCAIAFDRRGHQDVITHQGFGRCCSDAFGSALAEALFTADPRLVYMPSDQGIFTDTANYTDLIGECTNLSIGYEHEHSVAECLDLVHVDRVFGAVVDLAAAGVLADLPSVRRPGEHEWAERSWVDYRQYPIDDWREPAIQSSLTMAGDFFECATCGSLYLPVTSDAVEATRYCDRECENHDWRESQRPFRPSLYLDPAVQAIQDAIVVQAKRRVH